MGPSFWELVRYLQLSGQPVQWKNENERDKGRDIERDGEKKDRDPATPALSITHATLSKL